MNKLPTVFMKNRELIVEFIIHATEKRSWL